MTRKFDLVVIGTGSAASTVARECRSAGWEVAIVDSRPFGGTCALRGCDPKKVLVGAAEVTILHRGQRPLQGFDPDLVNQLVGRTKRLGINVEVGAEVEVIEKSGDK